VKNEVEAFRTPFPAPPFSFSLSSFALLAAFIFRVSSSCVEPWKRGRRSFRLGQTGETLKMERVSMRLVATLAVLALMILAASGQSDCKGKVGNYNYDLTPLAQKLGAVDLQTQDTTGQVYYYRVCGVVSNNFCQTVDDMTPAVCQKDTRIPAEFHDCGNQKTARFQKLPSGSERDGFTLAYTGGQDGRAAMIYFKWYEFPPPKSNFSIHQERQQSSNGMSHYVPPALKQRPVEGSWRVQLRQGGPHQDV
jgi:hypothetical protein